MARLGHGQGSYQCYCQSEKTKDDSICDEYKYDKRIILGISALTSVVIVGINYVLKISMNALVDRIGFKSTSKK